MVVKLTGHRRPPRARFVARLTSRTHQVPLSAAGLSAGQGVVLIVNSRERQSPYPRSSTMRRPFDRCGEQAIERLGQHPGIAALPHR